MKIRQSVNDFESVGRAYHVKSAERLPGITFLLSSTEDSNARVVVVPTATMRRFFRFRSPARARSALKSALGIT